MSGEGNSLRRIQQAVLDTLGLKVSHMAIGRVIKDARIKPSAA